MGSAGLVRLDLWKQADMPVTLRDVAKRLDLSHATVSFVLNDRRDVAIPERTRERVKAMAIEMGYRPNRAAQALVRGRHDAIAVVTALPLDDFGTGLLRAAEAALKERNLEPVWLFPTRPSATLPPTVDGVLRIDGASFDAPGDVTVDDLDPFPARADIARLAARDLSEALPRGEIVIGGRASRDGDLVAALAAYLRLEGREVLTTLHEDEEELVTAMTRLTTRGSLVAPDGRIARRLLRATECPVVNLRGGEEDEWTSPSLSGFRIPIDRMASAAVARLCARIEGSPTEVNPEIDRPVLVLRESTPRQVAVR